MGQIHSLAADHELIRETMVRFGEMMDAQGYRKVLEDIEGQGAIGKAVADPRNMKALRVIDGFMKEIHREIQKEPPSQEKANAMAAHQAAVARIKTAINSKP